MESIQIITRPLDPKTDEPFIYATWARNCYYSAKEPIKTPKKEWFAEKTKEIKEHLENSNFSIACLKSDPDFIVGYSVLKQGQLEWLYVRKYYRNVGVETLLVDRPKEKAE